MWYLVMFTCENLLFQYCIETTVGCLIVYHSVYVYQLQLLVVVS